MAAYNELPSREEIVMPGSETVASTTVDYERHLVAVPPLEYTVSLTKKEHGGIKTFSGYTNVQEKNGQHSSTSLRRTMTPVLENSAPSDLQDKDSFALMSAIEWSCRNDIKYLQFLRNMVILLRASYKLYNGGCMFALDHCKGRHILILVITQDRIIMRFFS